MLGWTWVMKWGHILNWSHLQCMRERKRERERERNAHVCIEKKLKCSHEDLSIIL